MTKADLWWLTRAFPLTLIVLDLGAASIYLWCGDLRRTIYWTAAAILTASVTF